MNVTGFAIVKVNGKSPRTIKASLKWGGYKRTAVKADGVVIGPQKKPQECEVDCTFAHTSDFDMQILADAENVTILFQSDVGPKYTIRNAWSEDGPELDADAGEVKIKFQGPPPVKS